jgi:hypothetical protein
LAGVGFDPGYLPQKADPYTKKMFERIDKQMLERMEKQKSLKALAAKWLDEEPGEWDMAPLTLLSKEERAMWLDVTFGMRYGRGSND